MAPILSSLIALSGLISTAYCLPSTERSTDTISNDLDLAAVSPGLPAPTSSPSIIALGVGSQNYTCNSTTGTYSSNVAVADLYDIGSLVKPSTKDSLSKLYLQTSDCSNEKTNPLQLNLIGDHYFDSSSVPNFDFAKSNRGWLQAKKGAGVAAPETSAKGIKGDAHGTIDWLYLLDNGAGVSTDLLSVYRVWTAGGKPPQSCSGDEQVEIPYAAEYWFYDATF
ncbi:hypothetical protein Q7P37_011222 [Cladosporium fusiforme]